MEALTARSEDGANLGVGDGGFVESAKNESMHLVAIVGKLGAGTVGTSPKGAHYANDWDILEILCFLLLLIIRSPYSAPHFSQGSLPLSVEG